MKVPETNMTKIVIVDDHPLVRERLAELIDREDDLVVCGEAEDRHEALSIIAQCKPSLAIVDLSLKSSLGIELIKDLQALHPEVKTLVVSMQDELIHAESCIRAGAIGFINKQQASRYIMVAIRQVLAGNVYLSEFATNQLITRSLRRPSCKSIISLICSLADRELQVFELVGKGHNTRQIADMLHLDVKTIETYRSRIKEKLSLKDGTELLQKAITWVHHRSF